MKIHDDGRMLELDPSKEYVMFVKLGTPLAKTIRRGDSRMENGQVFFVSDMDDFRFVENSDKIVSVMEEIKE